MTLDEFLNSDTDLQPVRQMAYGPVVGETHRDAMFGPAGNALTQTDVAASPDTGLKQGDLIMAQDGTLHTVADWSYLHPNQPTHNTIEFRDRKDQGHGFIKKVSGIDDFLGGGSSVSIGTATDESGNVVPMPAGAVSTTPSSAQGVTPPVTANLPPEEATLQATLQKNIKAGASAGVYPKAQPVTSEDRWAQMNVAQPPPDKSFQEKLLSTLEGKGSVASLLAPTIEGIRGAVGLPKTGPITEQDVAEAMSPDEAPLIGGKLPREERTPQDIGQTVTKAAYNTIVDLANFANTPTGAATILSTGGLPKIAQQLVALGFGAMAVKNAIDSASRGDVAGALEGLGIGALAGRGAKEIGKIEAEKPVAPPEGFEVKTDRQEQIDKAIADLHSEAEAAANPANYPFGTPEKPVEQPTTGVLSVEPPLPTAPATEDVTRAILDRRNDLINEAQQLGQQAEISRRMGQPVHPAVEDRIAAINQELNQPTIGSLERSFPQGLETPKSVQDWLDEPAEPAQPIARGEPSPEVRSTAGIAESPESTTPGDIATGQQPNIPERPAGVGAPPIAGARLITGEPVGISEARTEAELGVGSVEPGAGAEMGSGLAFGRDYINKGGDPRLPIRRALASGLVGKNEVGIVHAELERLRFERNKALGQTADHPNDIDVQDRFQAADQAQRAWRKELQPVLTAAGNTLREAYAQSKSQPDVGMYSGLSDLIDEHFKGQADISPEQRTALRKIARGVRDAREQLQEKGREVESVIKKGGRNIMTPEQLDADLKSVLADAFKDCIV